VEPLERFEFSQSNLQDFTDCRRRFLLRYIQHVAWPAVQAEPAREYERYIQRGERFHRLAQQYLIGVPEAALNRMAEADEDENLQRWWENFLTCIPPVLNSCAGFQPRRFVEVTLAAPLGRFRLVAKYDLVLCSADGRLIIFDWKTGIKKPGRTHLQERLQTRVYPFLMVQAGAALNQGRSVQPEQVEMVYWFAEPELQEERFQYDSARFDEDRHRLENLLALITGLSPEEFHMAESEKACPYCVYRSLCRRGGKAGELADLPEAQEVDGTALLDFDLEQIAEISF
jgi:hypothetical protein